MENASKALIMAGSVLIGIMLATFFAVMLRRGGQLNANYDTQMSDNELVKFNSQFEVYAKADNTFFDVITTINLAYDINKRNGYDANNGVEIFIKEGNSIKYALLNISGTEKDKLFIDGNETKKQIYIYNEDNGRDIMETYKDAKFSCLGNAIAYNQATGKVKSMIFTKQTK